MTVETVLPGADLARLLERERWLLSQLEAAYAEFHRHMACYTDELAQVRTQIAAQPITPEPPDDE